MSRNMKKVLFFAGVIILLNVSHAISGAAEQTPRRQVRWADQQAEEAAEADAKPGPLELEFEDFIRDNDTQSLRLEGSLYIGETPLRLKMIREIDALIAWLTDPKNLLQKNLVQQKKLDLKNQIEALKEKTEQKIRVLNAQRKSLRNQMDIRDASRVRITLQTSLAHTISLIEENKDMFKAITDRAAAAVTFAEKQKVKPEKTGTFAADKLLQQQEEAQRREDERLKTAKENRAAIQQKRFLQTPPQTPRSPRTPRTRAQQEQEKKEFYTKESAQMMRQRAEAARKQMEKEDREEDIKSLAGEILTVAAEKAAEEKAVQAKREAQAVAAQAQQEALLQAERLKQEEAQAAAEQRRQQEEEREQQAKQLQQQREAEKRETAEREAAARAAEKQAKDHENAQRIKQESEEKEKRRQEQQLAAQKEEERKRALQAEQQRQEEAAAAAKAKQIIEGVQPSQVERPENRESLYPRQSPSRLAKVLKPINPVQQLKEILSENITSEFCALLWEALTPNTPQHKNAIRELFKRICDLTGLTAEKQRDWPPYAVAAAAGALGGTGAAHYYTENYKHAAAAGGAGALVGVAVAQKYDRYKKEWRPSGGYKDAQGASSNQEMFNTLTGLPQFKKFAQAWKDFIKYDADIRALFKTEHFTMLKDGKITPSYNKEWRRTLRWVLKNLMNPVGRDKRGGGYILNCALRSPESTLHRLVEDCDFQPSRAFRILSDFTEDDYKNDYRFPVFLWLLLENPQEAGPAAQAAEE